MTAIINKPIRCNHMRSKLLPLLITLGISMCSHAETVCVPSMRFAGPYSIKTPYLVDSVDVNSAKFKDSSLLNLPLPIELVDGGNVTTDSVMHVSGTPAIYFLGFSIDNPGYAEGKLDVYGVDKYSVYVDGKKADDLSMALAPATHKVVLKCFTDGSKNDTVRVSVSAKTPHNWVFTTDDVRRYTLNDVMNGMRIYGASISPSGKYMLTTYYYTNDDGNSDFSYKLTGVSDGRQLASFDRWMSWMPKSDLLYTTRMRDGKRQLLTVDPVSGVESVIAKIIPEGSFMFSPDEKFIIVTKIEKGPEEKTADLYEIVHPEDRQPHWRDRSSLMKVDLATGLIQPLTFGYKGVSLRDISSDGKQILFSVSESRLEERPTTLISMYLMDLATLESDKIIDKDGFVASAALSPDGDKIAVVGSPEAFNGIGKNLREDLIPSMYDNQIFLIDVAAKTVSPMTKCFNPSVSDIKWNKYDGNLYFTSENRDRVSLYRLNPSTGKIDDLGAKEDVVMGYDMAGSSPVMVYNGQGANNSDRLYTLNLKNMKHSLVEDLSAQRLAGIKLGKCEAWDYVTSRGDTIHGRYILPPDFDPAKKYPMVVNYYGGCSPTSRNFESRYPHHAYAAQGYVVLVINPSGASGFGQEYAARHVNTAGEGVAEDIIEGVKLFTASHPYVNADKIGCIGASYGGFMTQYLQTKTDIFAAAISHAGISDHTSYWGEGYWGYSYSEVSMANSYPWSDSDLYVKRSPLYNADKIHAPILFLHGDSDTNVPFGESIQMYTALKLLGRETAFVAVKGENHQILDYHKRKKWQNTIFAWFAKYLQDDPAWWEALYPKKSL